jgi:predicted permease
MDTFIKEIRYGVRSLMNRPAFSAVVILTLALGVGANTAIFSVVNGVLLRPLPFAQPDRLAMLWTDDPKHGLHEEGTAYLTFQDWKSQSRTFEDLAICTRGNPVVLTGAQEPERINTEAVSANLFSLLGRQPMLGRTFSADDLEHRERVAVLSYKLWQRRFGDTRDLNGRTIEIDGQSTQIIGVMPPDFFFPTKEAQLWQPVTSLRVWDREKARRFSDWWRVIGRLKPGATVQQAQNEMNGIGSRLEQAYPIPPNEDVAGFGVDVVPLMDQITGARLRLALWSLLGAILFVMLIACTNVANLTLARGATREREFAIRGALGASRARLIRHALTENILIACGAGLIGFLLAAGGIRALIAFAPQDLPRLEEVRLDVPVLGFTLALSLLASILFGLWPALRLSRTDPNEALKEGSRGLTSGPARQRTRSVLIAAEVALSVVLLVGAGLLIRSFLRIQQVDPGFSPARVLAMRVELPAATPSAQVGAFHQQVFERVAALPGVESVGAIRRVFLDTNPDISISVQGHPPAQPGEAEQLMYDEVSTSYFITMRIPLRKGRFFSDQDTPDSPLVAIINETMARRFFPDEDPIGRRFKEANSGAPLMTIVGVVGDMRREGLERRPISQFFLSLSQRPIRGVTLVVRASADPLMLADAVRREIVTTNKQAIIYAVTTIERQLEELNSQRRFQTGLLSLFALLALALAAVGIFGVMSYNVTQRTHEMGIRLALGAQQTDVLRLVIWEGMTVVLVGLASGIAAAFWMTPILASLLFGIGAADPLTFAAMALLLSLVALVAIYIPARRATKVDPLVALRYE